MDSFRVNAFYITGLFLRRSCGCHSDNQLENLLPCEEKEQPVGYFYRFLITGKYSFPAQSVGRPNKQKNDVAIHRYSLNSWERSGRERGIIPSLQFKFLQYRSFRKPKYLRSKILRSFFLRQEQRDSSSCRYNYVSDKEVRLRTKSAYQIT